MSVTLTEQNQVAGFQADVTNLQRLLTELEREVARLKAESTVPRAGGDWRAAMERLQQGCASMDPAVQEECLTSLEEAERCSRALRVAD